jgi:hypothetical protein
MCINNMPSATGISTQYSPRELILRTRLMYKQHCNALFGSYCEVHEDNQPTNTMASRTTPAICCGPTGNLQGSYFFFSLVTGLLIKRRKWTELPVPDAVIERVAHFANKAGNPPGIVFSNRHRQPYDWPDNDIIGSDDTPMAIYPDIRADIPGVQLARSPTSPPSNRDAPNDDFDWAQMADEALANADIDDTEVLPPPPEVIIIDDDDDVPLPPCIKQTLEYLPKIEPDTYSTNLPAPRSPTSPPQN